MAENIMNKAPDRIVPPSSMFDAVRTMRDIMICGDLSHAINNVCESCGGHITWKDRGSVFMPDDEGNFMEWYCTAMRCDCRRINSMVDLEMVTLCGFIPDLVYKFRQAADIKAFNKTWGKDNG